MPSLMEDLTISVSFVRVLSVLLYYLAAAAGSRLSIHAFAKDWICLSSATVPRTL